MEMGQQDVEWGERVGADRNAGDDAPVMLQRPLQQQHDGRERP